MQKNPYLILGIDENATFAEVHDAYHKLKIKYQSQRFEEGEVGAAATRNLMELEQAYQDCLELLKSKAVTGNDGNVYSEISSLIKKNNLSKAQNMLDDIESRDAEWHYYQSIIYYKNNWVSDSKKQLEIAVSLDPTNSKYTEALKKMEANAQANYNANPNAQQQQRAGYDRPNPNAGRNANACCDTCCTLICCDSLCECCGGDLISCC